MLTGAGWDFEQELQNVTPLEKCYFCYVSFRNSNATDNFVKKKKKRDKLPLEMEASTKIASALDFYEISNAGRYQGQAAVSVAVQDNWCQDVSSRSGVFP